MEKDAIPHLSSVEKILKLPEVTLVTAGYVDIDNIIVF